MEQIKVKVGGMNCNHCKINVESGIKRISGIDFALADIINGEVTIKGDNIELAKVQNAIEDLGYFYDGVINQ
jgi:copper chaperone CopZ